MSAAANKPRILLIRLSALGDVIHTLPVLAALKTTYPESTIGWVVEAEAAKLLENHPLIDNLYVSERKRWIKSLQNPFRWVQTLREMHYFFKAIRNDAYDVGIDLQGLLKSSLTLWLTGISQRIGLKKAREGASWLYTQKVNLAHDYFSHQIPVVQHMLALLEPLHCQIPTTLSYPLPPIETAAKTNIQQQLTPLPSGRPLVVFAPYTKWQSKHWPSFHWQTLTQAMLAQTSANIVFIGSPQDQVSINTLLSEADIQSPRIANLAGKTSLQDLCALFEQAKVVVGADSAPLHLAGAVGSTKLIGLYGPTSPIRTPPPNPKGTAELLTTSTLLSCQPCHQRDCPLHTTECLTSLEPQRVLEAIKTALA